MNKHDLLRKLRALADSGEGGEKINAQRKLEEFMQKYGITEKDIEEETLVSCEFTYHGEREKALLVQIIYKVLNEKNRIYGFRNTASGRICKTKLGCKATVSQKIEIEFLFDFYKRLYERDEEFFFFAFIQKHSLFGELKGEEPPSELNKSDLLRMATLMEGMSEETPLKLLTKS